MCGIVGVLRSPRKASELINTLSHRGPDADGWCDLGACSLAMTRLAILDQSQRANPPMTCRDATIVFNGEIYNFLSLRQELKSLGWTFETTGDTEVLLKALLQWGAAALSRLRGMYAFLLWHADKGELWAARDKFGIKPLYWATGVENDVYFASEAKALTEFVGCHVSTLAVAEFLHFGSPYTATAFENVIELSPGVLSIWKSDLSVDVTPVTTSESLDQSVHELVGSAVKSHLVSDRPVALFLSGGFDSALIASQLAKKSTPPTAITIDTGDNSGDVVGARRTSIQYGLPHQIVSFSTSEIRQQFDNYIRSMDQPTVDGFNTFLVSNAANKAGFTVALSGLGGDEVFGGYGYYQHSHLVARASSVHRYLPRRLREGIERVLAAKTRRLPSQMASILAAHTVAERYRSWRCLFTVDEVRQLTGTSPGSPSLTFSDIDEVDRDDLRTMDFEMYLRSTLLRDTDVFSMACGVEVRVPLLDQLFVEQLARHSQAIDKVSMARTLDDPYLSELASQKKMTFHMPWHKWISILEKDQDRSEIDDPWAGLVDPRVGRQILDSPAISQAERKLALLMLGRWLHGVGPSRDIQKGYS